MDKQILITIDWYRPGFKAGGPVASVANLVDSLKNEFQFFILTGDRDLGDDDPYPGIELDRWIHVEKNIHVYYLSQEKRSKRVIRNIIKEIPFKIIYITGVYSFYFSILPLLFSKKRSSVKTIIATRGMFSPHAMRIKRMKKQLFLLVMKTTGAYKNVVFHVTHKQEAEDLRRLSVKNRDIQIIPNLPATLEAGKRSSLKKSAGSVRLISLGRISPEKNTLKALQILSEIKTGIISVDLYGHIDNWDYWKSCLKLIDKMPDNITIVRHAPLHPGEISDTIQDGHFLFQPTTGENYGHAIIECMSLGIPVIISDRTPWRNLEENHAGWDLPLEEEELWSQILSLVIEMTQIEYNLLSGDTKAFADSIINNPAAENDMRELFRTKHIDNGKN